MTHETARIFWMIFNGLGIVLAMMMLARVGAGTAFRAWLKAAWIAFMVLFCIRAYFSNTASTAESEMTGGKLAQGAQRPLLSLLSRNLTSAVLTGLSF
jgi:hypothetical protein